MKKTAEFDDDLLSIYDSISWCYTSIGDYKNALKYNLKAMKISPEREVIYTKFNINYLQGKYKKCYKIIKKIKHKSKTKQELSSYFSLLAELQMSNLKFDKAKKNINKALKLNPFSNDNYMIYIMLMIMDTDNNKSDNLKKIKQQFLKMQILNIRSIL